MPTWCPAKGKVYTVREVYERSDGRIGVILVEQTDNNWFYDICRFRPLITKTQSEDIEMFLRIASKAPSSMETTDA